MANTELQPAPSQQPEQKGWIEDFSKLPAPYNVLTMVTSVAIFLASVATTLEIGTVAGILSNSSTTENPFAFLGLFAGFLLPEAVNVISKRITGRRTEPLNEQPVS